MSAHQYIAKRETITVGGELAEVRLIVFRDHDAVHLQEGDEFFTIATRVPLFDEEGS